MGGVVNIWVVSSIYGWYRQYMGGIVNIWVVSSINVADTAI
jgi:hypothetical protein